MVGSCAIKLASPETLRGLIAVIIVNRPVVIPPQGKAEGLTPALDVSNLYVPGLQSKSTGTAAARANVQRLRKVAEMSETAYFRMCKRLFPIIKCAAMVDQSIPDINMYPQTGPGTRPFAATTAVSFAGLKSELKRAVLPPLFPNFSTPLDPK
ncbi:hypothetical protein H9P43_006919 [Blastocladiella emersonii ATCC 22665]|nr:hypothetical protein H9P43_006919 [Blastocladiella emersonii ATCC 22665]